MLNSELGKAQKNDEVCKPSILGTSVEISEYRTKLNKAKTIDFPVECNFEIVSYSIVYAKGGKIIDPSNLWESLGLK